jgi:hypothetical protein
MVSGISTNNTAAPSMGVGAPLNMGSRNMAGVGKDQDNSFYKSSKE